MPLKISRNDIRRVKADAIVDPTDRFLSGAGGTDRAIHRMAGKALDEVCKEIGTLEIGSAVITDSFDCKNCRYIIHTCGPEYVDGKQNEAELLTSCYRNCLELAKQNSLSSIAFPLISSGTFSFPKGQALRIASDTITEFLLENEMDVFLLVYDEESFDTAGKLFSDIRSYLDKNLKPRITIHSAKSLSFDGAMPTESFQSVVLDREEVSLKRPRKKKETGRFEPDESFSECMIRMIDEKGLLDPDVYKKANIDRKHFNHIKNTKDYRPKKETAVALAIGMKLDMKETGTLLERAGFLLSRSSKFDLIIRYCIEHGIYDIFQINEILFEEDQKTLGC